MLRRLLLTVLSLALLAATPARATHPQDGPHADLRAAIEDDAVRWSIGINLAFIDEMFPPSRESMQAVSDAERDTLLARLAQALAEDVRVEVDGVLVTPKIHDLVLHADPDPAMVVLFPRTGMRGLIRAVAVLEYPSPTPPQRVDLTWPTYPEDKLAAEFEGGDERPAMVLEAQLRAEGVLQIVRFSQAQPTVTWHREGADADARFEPVPPPPAAKPPTRLPVLSLAIGSVALLALLCCARGIATSKPWFTSAMVGVISASLAWALSGVLLVSLPSGGPELPTEDQIASAFRPLHTNLYRAFDYTAEGDVYDALSRSIDGPLLGELYTQVRESLVQAEQGGMLGIVTGVEPLDLQVDSVELGEWNGQTVVTGHLTHTWRIDGTVYHWGHSHTRQMEYDGRYTIAALPQGWRIIDHEILRQTRLDPGADPAPTDMQDLINSLGGDDI